MGCYRVPSPTPSAGSDAPIPETLQEDPTGSRIPRAVRTRRLSQAFSEAEQPSAKRLKQEPLEPIYEVDSFYESEASTEEKNFVHPDEKKIWVLFIGNLHPRTTQAELYNLFRDPANPNEDLKIRSIIIRNTRGCGTVVIPDEDMVPSDRCYASIEFIGHKEASIAWHRYPKDSPPILHGFTVRIGLSPLDMPDGPELVKRFIGFFPGDKAKSAGQAPPKRITVQKTEVIIEDEPKPLAGPSKRSAKPKSKQKTTGGATPRRRGRA